MDVMQLIIQGREDCGQLEKFADSFNSLARSFWQGYKVELLQDGKNCTLQASGNGKTVAFKWGELGLKSCCIYPVGPIIGLVVMLAYALACIPVTITMAIGLAAKKIALAKDEHSYRYHIIAQKYLVFSKQDRELKQLTQTLELKNGNIIFYQRELQKLESIKILSEESSTKISLEKTVKEKKELIDKRIIELSIKTIALNENIRNLAINCDGLKSELTDLLKTYSSKKNEEFDKIDFSNLTSSPKFYFE